MRSLPPFFLLFCALAVIGLGVADTRGFMVRGLFTAAQNVRTFASHYHK